MIKYHSSVKIICLSGIKQVLIFQGKSREARPMIIKFPFPGQQQNPGKSETLVHTTLNASPLSSFELETSFQLQNVQGDLLI